MIDLSIVIANWNTNELLKNCINSIYRETKKVSFEIIVFDNGSTDGSCEMARLNFPLVNLIESPHNIGFTKATNMGVSVSTGRYILLLNTDTIILDGAIDKLIGFADKSSEAGIFGPKLVNPDGTLQHSCMHFPKVVFKNRINISRNYNSDSIDWLRGACLMIKKEVINDIGYLDERFTMYGEDIDFCYRAKKKGWKIAFCPDSKILHFGWKSGIARWGVACISKAHYEATIQFLKKHKPFLYQFSYRLTRSISCFVRTIYLTILSIFFRKPGLKEKKEIYWLGFLICINGEHKESKI